MAEEAMHAIGEFAAGTVLRWRRCEDGSGEHWSRWHTTSGPCPACCCGGVYQCGECGGGRTHQEPGEPISVTDCVHIWFCQVCGEDLIGEHPETEEAEHA